MYQMRVIKVVLLLWLGLWAMLAQAAVGRISHLSGPLFVQKDNGTVKVLALESTVETGDTLITEYNTFARLLFEDGAEVVLRPNTRFQVASYRYTQDEPEKDGVVLRLLKGGFRAVTGWIGKRGNRDAYRVETPVATIGIRGTTYDALYISDPNVSPFFANGTPLESLPGADVTGSNPPALSRGTTVTGLHVQTISGAIVVSNIGGQILVAAGQTGYASTSPNVPPVLSQLPIPTSIVFPPFPPTIGEPSGTQSVMEGSTGLGGSCLIH